MQLGFRLCYTFYNFSGAVKVSAPIKYADRQAAFAGEVDYMSPHKQWCRASHRRSRSYKQTQIGTSCNQNKNKNGEIFSKINKRQLDLAASALIYFAWPCTSQAQWLIVDRLTLEQCSKGVAVQSLRLTWSSSLINFHHALIDCILMHGNFILFCLERLLRCD